ncbi:Pycsar system effector family protein [Kitasatospora sp. NPDC004614]|uniref:Pycsar system effector family protein n=1 Tax=unclassified Kitasatospora TaxID=2633591 RepID=UPI00368E75C1
MTELLDHLRGLSMSETNGGAAGLSPASVEAILSIRSAAALVDLQRADGKAATLCALASGTLAAVMAAAPAWSGWSKLLSAAVLVGCALLFASAAAALIAIRPVLPQGRLLAELEPFRSGAATVSAHAGPMTLDGETLIDLEVQRLRRLAVLAERKYLAVRVSVDLIASAGTVTGIGLLLSCAA